MPRRIALDIALRGSELRATFAGATGAPLTATRNIDLVDARRVAGEALAIVNRATRWADADQGSRTLLRRAGELLFDRLLPAPIKSALRGVDGGELALVLDEAMAFVPWELMHTGSGFLGLTFALGRTVRGEAARLGDARPEPDGPWRMLIVCDPRGDLISSYFEGLTLRDEIQALPGERVTVDLRASEVSLDDVRASLREYDIVHYAGHVEAAGGSGRGWWLRDGVLEPSCLLELAGGRPFPRFVFSNACRSARLDEGDVVVRSESLAHGFLRSGVRHYVGTLWDVPDEPASLFALSFWAALAADAEPLSLGEAMRRARAAVAARYGAESVYWAAWVLYGDPGGTCLTVRTKATPEAAQTPKAPAVAHAGARMRGHAQAAMAPEFLRMTRSTALRLGRLAGLLAALALLGVGAWALSRRTTGTQIVEGARAWPEIERAPMHPVPAAAGPLWIAGDHESWELGAVRVVSNAPAHALIPGEPFRLRAEIGRRGWIALYHVAASGPARHVYPLDAALAWAEPGRALTLPDADQSYALGLGAARERFYLAWREVAPEDAKAFAREIEAALDSARPQEVLEDRFDRVIELVIEPVAPR